jgi:hypothetical protein
MRHFALQAALAGLVLASAGPAGAEVHFGNNVFIGGHNFSHQTYNRHHRLHVMLYDHPIRGAGCVTRGAVRTCRLQRIPH